MNFLVPHEKPVLGNTVTDSGTQMRWPGSG
jgi:hypothetical protein